MRTSVPLRLISISVRDGPKTRWLCRFGCGRLSLRPLGIQLPAADLLYMRAPVTHTVSTTVNVPSARCLRVSVAATAVFVLPSIGSGIVT